MGWDPSVMRKFAATSHQRLLHQLRGELQSNHGPQRLPETVLQPDSRATAPARPGVSGQKSSGSKQEKRPRSFRERLNAIDLC